MHGHRIRSPRPPRPWGGSAAWVGWVRVPLESSSDRMVSAVASGSMSDSTLAEPGATVLLMAGKIPPRPLDRMMEFARRCGLLAEGRRRPQPDDADAQP